MRPSASSSLSGPVTYESAARLAAGGSGVTGADRVGVTGADIADRTDARMHEGVTAAEACWFRGRDRAVGRSVGRAVGLVDLSAYRQWEPDLSHERRVAQRAALHLYACGIRRSRSTRMGVRAWGWLRLPQTYSVALLFSLLELEHKSTCL